MRCFFVSDLHGQLDRYQKLFAAIGAEKPEVVLLGGDLLPPAPFNFRSAPINFIPDVLRAGLAGLRHDLGPSYPRVLLIPGNDDTRAEVNALLTDEEHDLWEYIHARKITLDPYTIYGYAHIPPTPFLLKDWERYDVSRYVDPGCISPEEGWRSTSEDVSRLRFMTIAQELADLAGADDQAAAIWLCHAPPYDTLLDRAALDMRKVDGVPLDVHVGSIAVRRFIRARQPLVTLHGHIHESARLTGAWRDQIGRTHLFSAAHDGGELALVTFDPANPAAATRRLL